MNENFIHLDDYNFEFNVARFTEDLNNYFQQELPNKNYETQNQWSCHEENDSFCFTNVVKYKEKNQLDEYFLKVQINKKDINSKVEILVKLIHGDDLKVSLNIHDSLSLIVNKILARDFS